MDAVDAHLGDPAVIAWHVDIKYEVLGAKKRGSAAPDAPARRGVKRLLKSPPTLGNVRYVHAVKDVSFTAHRGESIGIIGHNGSGKSTLLRALAGLVPPSNGHIWLQGQPSLLGVNAVLLNELSGERNIYIGGQALGLSREEIRERYDDIVALADVGEAIDRPMSTYSSGQGARLRFAISTAVRPDILMIDEALATGDAAFRQRSTERIEELLDGASTVFLVSHSNSTITQMCKRALWLDHGRLVMDGPSDEVVAAYATGRVPSPDAPFTAEAVQSFLDPGADIEVVEVDRNPPPLIRAVVWAPGNGLLQEGSPFDPTGLLAGISSAGILNLVCPRDGAADGRWSPVGLQEHALTVELRDDPLAVVLPRLLHVLALDPQEVLVLDGDASALGAIRDELPGIQTRETSEAATQEFLNEMLRRYEGTGLPVAEPYATTLRRDEAHRASSLGSTPFRERHPLSFTILDRLDALHLDQQIEALVDGSRALNWTGSALARGQARGWISDVRNHRSLAVVAWDDFGSHGVVGFVSVRPGPGTLEHFTFADRCRDTGLPEAVAATLIARFGMGKVAFPVEPDDGSCTYQPADSAGVQEQLSSTGLAAPSRADVRVMMGPDSGQLIQLLAPLVADTGHVAGQASIKDALGAGFQLEAPVVAYWAGREYDDQVWGAGGRGIELFTRAATSFAEKCGAGRVLVFLPPEDFEDNPARPRVRAGRFQEYNDAWRQVAGNHADIELVHPEEWFTTDPTALHPRLLGIMAERIRNAAGAGDTTPSPVPTADPIHLKPVSEFTAIGPLAPTPMPLPAAWEGEAAAVWEVEVRTEPGTLSANRALMLIDVDTPETIRMGAVKEFGRDAAHFYHYLDHACAPGVSRFLIQGDEPFTPTNLALQLWGASGEPIRVDRVRLWVHR